MIHDVPAATQSLIRAIVACAVVCLPGGVTAAEARTNPMGGGDSVVLEPVPAVPTARTRRPVFVCRDGAGVVFADRPCGQVVEARAIELSEPGPGKVSSTARRPPTAAVRPRVEPTARDASPAFAPTNASGRCSRLRAQLETLDDRMRSGYSAREAARLWNRWREIKAQMHEARC